MPDNKQSNDDTKWDKVAQESASEEVEGEAIVEESEAEVSGILGHPSYKALEDELTKTEMKLHEEKNNAMRARADLENIRRRLEDEAARARKYSDEKFGKALLLPLDCLEQALSNYDPKHVESMREGLELTYKMFLEVLAKFAIQQEDPLGKEFNPQLHEAVAMEENSDAKAGTVLNVYQKGYVLHDRVLRPARVVVAKKSSS